MEKESKVTEKKSQLQMKEESEFTKPVSVVFTFYKIWKF